VKRIVDIAGASVLLLLSLPLLVLAGIGVKLSSPGPILFGHQRMGRDGRPFGCLKLRTMVVNAEEWLENDSELKARYKGNGYKLPRCQDPRVTSVGRFLRFSHLDELPQLLNVLKGDMSLVGPRPVVEEELEWYGELRTELLSVKPGVFGPWTGQGRNRVDYPDRTKIELAYVRDHSPMKDLAILMRNVPVVLRGQAEKPKLSDPPPQE
jgi:lipopolysaccharide/colanic/teichoic acid biosynthesis glycosyltransferase